MPEGLFDISIIIPAKNEERRLPPFLREAMAYCQKSKFRYEIIVVDDGSSDNTYTETQRFQATFPDLKILRLPVNHGKGYAVKQGMLASQGQIALFIDADGSTPVTEIEKHLPLLNKDFDIIIGSRVLASDQCSIKTKPYRKLMGMIFNSCVHIFLIQGIADTQCGFKMFRREIIRPLWKKVHLEGFGFDLEVLYLAQQMGLRIKEIPVNWTHVAGSKVDLVNDSLRMFGDIFRIKKQHHFSSK